MSKPFKVLKLKSESMEDFAKRLQIEVERLHPKVLAMAVELADEAATSAIECHGRRTDMEPGSWYDIAGEPVELDVAYLKARGLLTYNPMSPTLVGLVATGAVHSKSVDK